MRRKSTRLIVLGASPGVVTDRVSDGDQVGRRIEMAQHSICRGSPKAHVPLDAEVVSYLQRPSNFLIVQANGRKFERRIHYHADRAALTGRQSDATVCQPYNLVAAEKLDAGLDQLAVSL